MGVDDGFAPGLRTIHRSPAVHIVAGPSRETSAAVGRMLASGSRASVRYYLCAGTGPFTRPPWRFGRRPPPGGAAQPEPVDAERRLAESILSFRDRRDVAFDAEMRAIESAHAGAGGAQMRVVVEVLGLPSRDDVAFWQGYRLRLAGTSTRLPPTLAPLLVLQHDRDARNGGAWTDDPERDEILVALLLAGGYAWKPEFERWAALRAWPSRLTGELTSTRDSASGPLYTYAAEEFRSRAWAAYPRVTPESLAALATMVVSEQPEPLLATATLAPDIQPALLAFGRLGDAEGTGTWPDVARYGRILFRTGRRHRWTRIPKRVAGTVYLASIVANRSRIAPAAAAAVLNLAERFKMTDDVRSLLAYSLGQLLAKDTGAPSWAAGLRCFAYAQACSPPRPGADPEVNASRQAAAHNGSALAFHRSGDRAEAVRAELAALDALTAPEVLDRGHLHDQRILVMTNLAKAYGRGEDSRDRALAYYRQAWQVACDVDSIAGMAYVAADLVRTLLAAGDDDAAGAIAHRLLSHYDRTPGRSRNGERAVAAVCWSLADSLLARGRVRPAALWYLRGVRRMRPGVPDVVNGIIQNLLGQPETPPASIMRRLTGHLVAHRAAAADLAALLGLWEEGGHADLAR